MIESIKCQEPIRTEINLYKKRKFEKIPTKFREAAKFIDSLKLYDSYLSRLVAWELDFIKERALELGITNVLEYIYEYKGIKPKVDRLEKNYDGNVPRRRADFKKMCIRNFWNMEDFEEIESDVKKGRFKTYHYYYRGEKI